MKKQDYLDRVLIQLKRQYSKEEVVAAMAKKLSEAEVKNGILLDEIQELKEEVQRLKAEQKRLTAEPPPVKGWAKEVRKEVKKEAMYQELLKQCDILRQKLKKYYQERDMLISQLNTKHNDNTTTG